MARDRSPITKQSRREGYALHPKAHKIMVRRTNTPGEAGADGGRRRGKPSQYSMQLREKQKVKRLYGLLEKPFRNLMKEASKREGLTGENLIKLLENRLDNAVYRGGFSSSRRGARQLVNHGHFELNGRRVDIPSIQVSSGDVITTRDRSKKTEYFKNIEQYTSDVEQPPLSWLKSDIKKMEIKITGEPKREEAEPDINEQLIVEYYSR